MISEWNFQPTWELWGLAIVGLIVAWLVALRPRRFWPMLLAISVGTGGLIIQGYGLVDEFLIGTILLGGFLAMSVRGITSMRRPLGPLHQSVFITFMLYLCFQSIRGSLILEDWRILRFALLFAMLALLAVFGRSFPMPPAKRTVEIIAVSSLVYLAAYLGYGMYAETVRAVSRFEHQGIEWSGSAYALFLLVVTIPAMVLLIEDRSRFKKSIGLILGCLAAATGGYYDSRISLVAFSAFLIPRFVMGLRKWTLPGAIVILFFAVGSSTFFARSVFVDIFNQIAGVTPAHDFDRILALLGAITAAGSDLTRLFIGDGFWVHRFTLVPYLGGVGSTVVRTTGFSALLTDTGMVGILLLAVNFLLATRGIMQRAGPTFQGNKIILVTALLMTAVWLFVANVLDIVLLYMLIMPSGLLAQLAQIWSSRATGSKGRYGKYKVIPETRVV